VFSVSPEVAEICKTIYLLVSDDRNTCRNLMQHIISNYRALSVLWDFNVRSIAAGPSVS
jgi:hypothetical protein